MTVEDVIIGFAKTVLGQKEKPGNSGFESEWIQKKMTERGFVKGDAWCALAWELIMYEVYEGSIYESYINDLCSKSAVQTYKNFRHKSPFICNDKPKPGSGVFWQYYKTGVKTWQGHCGIVTAVFPAYFTTIEGNGNSAGSREGIE
jgi:hypothetical protein